MDPAGELAQLDERSPELIGGRLQTRDRLGVGVRTEPRARHPEREGRRDQALLGAIVQVSLEAATFSVRGLDDPRTRPAELLLGRSLLAEVTDDRRRLIGPARR